MTYKIYGIESVLGQDNMYEVTDTVYLQTIDDPVGFFTIASASVNWIVTDLTDGDEDILHVLDGDTEEPLFICVRKDLNDGAN